MRAVVDRLPGTVRHFPEKVFPGHWSFLLGEVTMFSFFVLLGTGIYLALFFEASAAPEIYRGSYEPMAGIEVPRSYGSVMDITFDRPAGAVIRQTHHWASLVFVGSIVLHAARVFFTGAFRRPRRLNWMIGVTLLISAMATGFFGLSLPHDLIGATGARIGHSFAVSIPVIGPGVADLLFAGEYGNPQMVHRFWVLHVLVFPVVILGLMTAHLTLVWVQTHTQHRGPGKREDNVVGHSGWPGYTLKATGLFLTVAGVLFALGALVEIAPIWLDGPFSVGAATVPAQPDWYLSWVEGALRILPPVHIQALGYEVPSAFFIGVVMPSVVFLTLYCWPFVEERLTGDRGGHHLVERPRDHPVRTAIGVAGLTFLTVLVFGAGQDLHAFMLKVPVGSVTNAYRVILVVGPLVAGMSAWWICRSLVSSEREGLGQLDSGDEHARREREERQEREEVGAP